MHKTDPNPNIVLNMNYGYMNPVGAFESNDEDLSLPLEELLQSGHRRVNNKSSPDGGGIRQGFRITIGVQY